MHTNLSISQSPHDRRRAADPREAPGAFQPRAVRHSGWGPSTDNLSLTSYARVGFLTKAGALTAASEGLARLVPLESLEAGVARRAVCSGRTILRPAVDHRGRTVIILYAPAVLLAGQLEDAEGCAAFLVSLVNFGDALREAGVKLGMGNFTARVCAGLIENGSLRRAATDLGVTHQTARSEVSDAMRLAETTSQCGLVARLAADWLCDAVDSERAINLLMTTFGLTLRDAKVASLRATGDTRPQVARRLGLSRWAVEDSCANVFSALGVIKAPDLTRIVIDLLLASDLAERCHHDAQPTGKLTQVS